MLKQLASVKLFKAFGIRVEVHFTFILLMALVAWRGWREGGWAGVGWHTSLIGLVFACVVLHELGHCLVALRFGVPISRILLLPIGGMAQFGEIPRRPVREILITLAGPMVNFLLALLIFLIFGWPNPALLMRQDYAWAQMAGLLLYFNLAMSLFNLLPVFPMDGGRLLRALLAVKLSYLTATRVAVVYVAKPLALAGVLAAIGLEKNWLLAALFAFIYLGGGLEYEMLKRGERFKGLTAGDLTRRRFAALPRGAPLGRAAALMRARQPEEILLMDGPAAVHVLLPARLKHMAKKQPLDTPLEPPENEPPPAALQAEWPLSLFADHFYRKKNAVYPVYEQGRLIGVLDGRQLASQLEWLNLMRNSSPAPAQEKK